MNEFLRIFFSYLKQNVVAILMGITSLCIFLTVFYLYSIPTEVVGYAAVLCTIAALTAETFKFISFYRRHRELIKLKNHIINFEFFNTTNVIEQDYQELIKEIEKSRTYIINEKNKSYWDMIDYYTIWAHQIKTPIAAMRLILQSEKSETNSELLEQLFKTEQYVEMALQYLRLKNISNDLAFKKCSLDHIVKHAVKKYSKTFIRRKITLNYAALNIHVLTDEKWLTFVLEQILSNALKYTTESSGCISIYMDKILPCTLVIEDNGIGIKQEDLPRVFEKGFTGYNGRIDKKSTGIGLFLCKEILTKISHTIKIESEEEKGTKVKIGLDVKNISSE